MEKLRIEEELVLHSIGLSVTMNVTHKSMRRFATNNALSARDTICTSCRLRIQSQARRYAATAAAAVEQSEPIQQQDPPVPPVTQTEPRKAYRVLASTVLSRPPLLTRDLTPFEKAFYLYQKRLNERLALPFTQYFYYKKDTPAAEEWKRKRKARKTAAKDIGVYSGYGAENWNDEALVGDTTAEPSSQIAALIKDAEGKDIVEAKPVGDSETGGQEISGNEREGEGVRKPVGQQVAVEKPMPRSTQADEENDLKSLSRRLDRSLYLLVKNKDGRWRFPEDRVYGRENLAQAAERLLIQSCGLNMNTWIVGNHPIGHYSFTFPSSQQIKIAPNRLVSTSNEEIERDELGEKVFFMKGRILAGQADLSSNEYGDQEFQWLAKEEIEKRVLPKYWASIKDMLTER